MFILLSKRDLIAMNTISSVNIIIEALMSNIIFLLKRKIKRI
jgi:hypothetical protein